MQEAPAFDYYYGDEGGQFSYFRIPRQLVTDEKFRRLSTDAKLLYGLFLDRMGLSAKNGWYDKLGRVFIFYTLDEIQADLNCGHDKATKLLVELDTGRGIGLIERVRQGQGKPTWIYVKRFTTGQIPPRAQEPRDLPPSGSPECGKGAVQSAEKPQSRVRRSRSPECGQTAGIYPDLNQTDFSPLEPSIHPSAPPTAGRWMDRSDCRREVEDQIEFSYLCGQFGYKDVDGVVELMVDTLCSTSPTLRIGGERIPADQVKSRFLTLDSRHLEYVFDCMRRNTTQVRNIRAYLLTALYNAPATINHYYQAEVQHDFG